MDCRLCRNSFSNQKGHLPRVLISCGHTLCENCIENSFLFGKIHCKQCDQVSFGSSFQQYPVNANLLSILNSQSMCKTHNQKLEAYCQKDNELLCLNCVIGGGHKSHKISSISQKVQKDRSILEECSKQINSGRLQMQENIKNILEYKEKIENDYKDILLDVGLFFSSIKDSLQQIESSYMNKIKKQYENAKEKMQHSNTQLIQKSQFLEELLKLYHELMKMEDLKYLHEDNKRIFIVENCKQKKQKIQYPKLSFSKISAYNQVLANVQDLLSYEKKIQNQMTPSMKNKKKSSKEPTILEVNLHEQYSKHYKNFQPNSTMQHKTKHNKNASVNLKTPRQNQKNKIKKQSIPQSQSVSQEEKHNTSIQQFNEPLQASMVDSFMRSSVQSFTIKGSQAEFTMYSYKQKLYHFGSFNDSSIQVSKLEESGQSSKLGENVFRSKFQCVNFFTSTKCLIFGGKSGYDEKLNTFLQYDFLTDKISECNFTLSEAKSGFGAVTKQSKIYVCGGSNDSKSLKTFEEYRLTGLGLACRELAPMNFSRDQLGMCLGYDGNIYACGGINETGAVLSSCERYNWKKSKWEKISNMKIPRRCFALASLPQGLLAIGGFNGKQYLNNVELYDLDKEKWVQMPPLSMPRFAHTAVITNDLQSVIVSGGFNKEPLKSVEIFDTMEGKWRKGGNMATERFLHSSLIVNF